MPKQITLTVYTLAELKTANPKAYVKLHEEWKEGMREMPVPWEKESLESVRKTLSACGYNLDTWSLPILRISPIGQYGGKDWRDKIGTPLQQAFFKNVLEPLGYQRMDYGKTGKHIDFPGKCPFTGYCLDEDLLEAIWNRLGKGDYISFPDALRQAIGNTWNAHLDDAMEQQCNEESMEANWGELHYTLDGQEITLPK